MQFADAGEPAKRSVDAGRLDVGPDDGRGDETGGFGGFQSGA